MGRISRRSIGVFMAVAMATSWAVTQENDQPLAMFFAPVDVPLVSVEVYVSDRSGHPVRGPMSGHHGGMWITDESCSLLAISGRVSPPLGH